MKIRFLCLVGLMLAVMAGQVQAGPIFAFTNAGANGLAGPTQGMVNSAYTSTNLAGDVVVNAGIQQWIVPTSGLYSITASGASGGSTTNATGGRGATITIQKNLTAGVVLDILVGQAGGLATFGGYYGGETGGGGGGSFIVDQSNNAILVVGGGGGAAEGAWGGVTVLNGVDASAFNETFGQNGTSSGGSWSIAGVGGTNGQGGTQPGNGGGGGGGFLTNGQGGSLYAGDPGLSFLNGGSGGANQMYYGSFIQNIAGGFGGGAGAGAHENYESNAGGGGGYSGGGGGNTRVGAGGGGGNFYDGIFVSSGFNIGHGEVSFELLSSQAVPEPSTFALFGMGAIGMMFARRRRQQHSLSA